MTDEPAKKPPPGAVYEPDGDPDEPRFDSDQRREFQQALSALRQLDDDAPEPEALEPGGGAVVATDGDDAVRAYVVTGARAEPREHKTFDLTKVRLRPEDASRKAMTQRIDREALAAKPAEPPALPERRRRRAVVALLVTALAVGGLVVLVKGRAVPDISVRSAAPPVTAPPPSVVPIVVLPSVAPAVPAVSVPTAVAASGAVPSARPPWSLPGTASPTPSLSPPPPPPAPSATGSELPFRLDDDA